MGFISILTINYKQHNNNQSSIMNTQVGSITKYIQPEKLIANNPFSQQTDLSRRLRELERQAAILFQSKKYPQASSLIETLLQGTKQYYKLVPAISKNMQAIRIINKLKKKQELILFHNQAVIFYASHSMDQAIQQLTIIIEQIVNMIQSQQTKYGFLLESQQSQRTIIIQSINGWKQHLIRYYYFLAKTANIHSNREIALASLMKGLDFIKELYKFELKIIREKIDNERDKNQTYARHLCSFEQIEQLYLLCELRDKVSYSKYLNIVSINTLIQTTARLFDVKKAIQPNSAQCECFQLNNLIKLQLPPLQRIISSQYIAHSSINSLSFNKSAQFIYYDLIGRIQSQKNKDVNSDYERLKHTKNIILLHMFQGIIYHYLPLCPKVHQILQEYSQMYKQKSKNIQKKQIKIYQLIDLFGLTPKNITEHTVDDLSIMETNEYHKKIKTEKDAKGKSKQKAKQKSVKKKSRSKSIGKQVVKKDGNQLNENRMRQQKEKKDRVRNQYKLKDKKVYGKPMEDHLTKAISQKYFTFDNSLSKDKNIPRKRSIRTQTVIASEKDKVKKTKIFK